MSFSSARRASRARAISSCLEMSAVAVTVASGYSWRNSSSRCVRRPTMPMRLPSATYFSKSALPMPEVAPMIKIVCMFLCPFNSKRFLIECIFVSFDNFSFICVCKIISRRESTKNGTKKPSARPGNRPPRVKLFTCVKNYNSFIAP